jgi:predicted PurR-regulated permease PerM
VDALPDQLGTFETRFTDILSQPISFNNQPILIDGRPFIPLEQLQNATGEETLGEMLRFEDIDFSGALQGFAGSLGGLTRPVFSFVGGAFNTFINLTFFLVMLFYLLKDGRKFVSTIVGLTPPSYQGDARRMFYETGQIWNAYFRGQLILSSWVGLLVFICATLVGLPNALVLGLISALLEFVPNIGPFIAMVPAAFVALISTSTTIPGLSGFGFALVVIAIYFTIQQVQAIVVTPRVMGDNLDLHPFLVILAVIAGASLAGALGVILAAPFMATVKMLGMYLYAKLTDRQPFTDWTAPPPHQLAEAQAVPLLPHGDNAPAERPTASLDPPVSQDDS